MNNEQEKFLEKLKSSIASSTNDNESEKQKSALSAGKMAGEMKTPHSGKIKNIRMLLDNLMIQSQKLSGNREMDLAYTNMQRGFMWMGKLLGALAEANPYPESTNQNSAKIEERTDQAKDNPATFEGIPEDRTAAVKWLRAQLDGVINSFEYAYYHEGQVASDALQEAKMWYGWELNNIRLSQEGK